jgi:gliding motility-associated-like protein
VYTYTVNGAAPCPSATATVTVNVITLPDPGTPGALTVCSTDPALALFAQLGGTPDAGGTWTAPGGASFTGTFDPSTDLAGIYTYTISVPPPCVSVTSTVTVTLNAPPDAGLDGTLALCATSGSSTLFNALGGTPDAGGTWTDPMGVAHSGTFDPAVDAPGLYTYTVSGLFPCPNASASATVTVTPQVNPGQPAILNLCVSGVPVDLFPALGPADANGTWTGPLGTSFNGTFVPGTDPAGAYTYTVAGTPPCPSGSAVITVNILSDPDAGLDGSLALCSSSAPVDLYSQLGGTPDVGGTWLDPLGLPVSSLFDPASAQPGTYTYLLLVPAPCVNDTSLVTMSVTPAADAGSDAAVMLCASDPAIGLFGLLGGTPDVGGTWTSPTNQAWTGTFDPAVDAPGLYTYTVAGTSPCPNDLALVQLTVEPLPNAGSNGNTIVCPDAPAVALFTLLGGTPDPGGQWTDPNGQPCTGTFEPANDPQGVYTYTVLGQGACPNASAAATVSIHVIAQPDAGPDVVLCGKSVALNATGIWTSGQWTAPAGVTVLDPASPTSIAVASSGTTAVLVWTIVTPDGCSAHDSVTITFTEPLAPTNITTDAICHDACDGTAQVSATGGYGNYGFQWSTVVPVTYTTTSTQTAALCAGSYTVTVTDGNGCSAQTTFTINEPPALVIDGVFATPETCPGSCDGTVTVVDPQGALFSFDNGSNFLPSSTITGLCAGPVPVVMMDGNGCLAVSLAEVLSPAPVIAEFIAQPDTVLVSDPFVEFTNQSENASWFTWNFAGLGTSDLHEPSFTFPGVLGGTYTVCLTAVNGNGCVDTVCHPVVVLDLLTVHVPNSFTPNGDGINEGFMPVFNEPELLIDYEFLVFDRWGEQLFESHTPHQPWDGWYHGQAVKEEVYVWKLVYKDGRSHKKEAVLGHVTVLK